MTNDLADRIADSILARIEQDRCVHKSSVADEVRKHLAVQAQPAPASGSTLRWYRINPSGIGPDASAAVDLEHIKAVYTAIRKVRDEEMIHPPGVVTVGALPQTEG